MSRSVLITGVSTGIGYHLFKEYFERGYQVFGSVRKESDREKLLEEFPGATPLLFDVTDADAVVQAVEEVKTHLGERGLDILINNAGIAVSGPLMLVDLEDFHRQFEVNVYGLLRTTQVFLPLLGAVENPVHPPGKILNISSVSGQLGFPFMGPYVSSKHAVEGLSQSLRRELFPFGIDVIIIAPGRVKTPIWKKASATEIPEKLRKSIFGKYLKKMQQFMLKAAENGLDPEKFARQVVAISEAPRPKTRYAFANNYFADWLLPRYFMTDRILDQVLYRELNK